MITLMARNRRPYKALGLITALTVFGAIAGLLPGCLPYAQTKTRGNLIKVAVLAGIDSVSIRGIRDRHFYENYRVGQTPGDTSTLYFKPMGDAVAVNGKKYRGCVEVRSHGGKFWIINILDIEDYLKGVVPCEIGSINRGLFEAGKAQAVAARTYAYGHMGRHQDLGFDVYATVQDQVYEGISAESEIISDAIAKTRGMVITDHGLPIDAKYHSTCGGMTADFNDAWLGQGPPYLTSVPCGFCANSPHYTWQKLWSNHDFFTQIRSRLPRAGITIGDSELIKNIVLHRNKKTQRVVRVTIMTDKNSYEIGINNIRTVFGDDRDPDGLLKSTWFTIQAGAGDSVAVMGKGWGHGVGMCQFGAMEMARQGKSFRQILFHYYPDTRIRRW
jgi:stage II sporulation protein D